MDLSVSVTHFEEIVKWPPLRQSKKKTVDFKMISSTDCGQIYNKVYGQIKKKNVSYDIWNENRKKNVRCGSVMQQA